MTDQLRTPDKYLIAEARPFWRGYATALQDMAGATHEARLAAISNIDNAIAVSKAYDAGVACAHMPSQDQEDS